jgi:tRNA U38,U39,U40 pseudouridine synthase TruA
MAVVGVQTVPLDFHARYRAQERTYVLRRFLHSVNLALNVPYIFDIGHLCIHVAQETFFWDHEVG